ncbi:MAG: hypothetical protein RL459_830 [Pseudomonadota bacterium]|jgi:5-carboxymethyl-2-hydroxymuconate isomerase
MPHIQIDYTANLEADIQERKLVETLHQEAVESSIFPVWGICTISMQSLLSYSTSATHKFGRILCILV